MVDGFNPEPGEYLYEHVAGHIEARIRSGELPVHGALPGERQLAHDYNVALGTARGAIRLLQRRGLIRTIRSKGSYVNPPEVYDGGPGIASVTRLDEHPGM